MDVFTLVMGLTLAVAGFFLFRDHAQFLAGTYSVSGKVTSMQHVFIHQALSGTGSSFVLNGFYPVVEYKSNNEMVSFTSIDKLASGKFHVGDVVDLKVTKSRRRQTRLGRTVLLLVTMSVLMMAVLFVGALFSQVVPFSATQIVLASIISSVSFYSLVLYVRDLDDNGVSQSILSAKGVAQLVLSEPAAYHSWRSALKEPCQILRIRNSQLFGSLCMLSAGVIVYSAFQPLPEFLFVAVYTSFGNIAF